MNDLKRKFAGSLNPPTAGELKSTIDSSLPNIRRYDDNPHNQDNNMSGWNSNVKDDSYEAGQEYNE